MSRQSIPRERGKHPQEGNWKGRGRPSTAPLVANEANCQDVARLLLLDDEMPALRAFLGEPLESVLHICRWVLANEGSENYDPARMIQAWAKKRGRGAWSDRPTEAQQIIYGQAEPDADLSDMDGKPRENEVLAQHILKFWIENPQRFVALLDEVEAHATGKRNGKGSRA